MARTASTSFNACTNALLVAGVLLVFTAPLKTHAADGLSLDHLSLNATTSRKLLQDSPITATFDINKWQEDLVGYAKDILSSKGSTDRASWVKDISARAKDKTPEYNILVCNINQDCNPALAGGPNKGYPAYTSMDWDVIPTKVKFGIWSFKTGTLDHCKSDGGYINWSFYGGERSGKNGCIVTWK